MNSTQVKSAIQTHTWWSEECPGKWQYYYCMYSFSDFRMYFHPEYLTFSCLTVRDGYVQEKTPSDERLKLYDWLKEQYQENQGFIEAEHERWSAIRDEVFAHVARVVSSVDRWSAAEVVREYNALLSRAIDSARWGTFIECIDDFNSFVLPAKMVAALPDVSPQERTRIMMVLSAPLMVSFMEEFQLEKAQCIFQHRETIKKSRTWEDVQEDPACEYAIEQLCSKYQWMSVNYGGSPALTPVDLFLQLHHEEEALHDSDIERMIVRQESKIQDTANEQAAIMREHSLSDDLLDDFSIIRSLGAWMDERKESMVKTTWALTLLFDRMAEVTCVPRSALEWYTKEEINELFAHKVIVQQSTIDARSHNSVFVTEWDGESIESSVQIFTGDEATLLYEALNSVHTNELRGIVASQGGAAATFSGVVQVLVDITKEPFIPGRILVTSMTRPEFVPLMKHALAVVTDEGGLTCHAAIVSRELNIPCIIGTQHATKMLHSGEKIEMDLHTGVIRKV